MSVQHPEPKHRARFIAPCSVFSYRKAERPPLGPLQTIHPANLPPLHYLLSYFYAWPGRQPTWDLTRPRGIKRSRALNEACTLTIKVNFNNKQPACNLGTTLPQQTLSLSISVSYSPPLSLSFSLALSLLSFYLFLSPLCPLSLPLFLSLSPPLFPSISTCLFLHATYSWVF